MSDDLNIRPDECYSRVAAREPLAAFIRFSRRAEPILAANAPKELAIATPPAPHRGDSNSPVRVAGPARIATLFARVFLVLATADVCANVGVYADSVAGHNLLDDSDLLLWLIVAVFLVCLVAFAIVGSYEGKDAYAPRRVLDHLPRWMQATSKTAILFAIGHFVCS